MKRLAISILAIILMLSGCGGNGKSNNEANQSETPEIIEAKLDVPEKADVNKDVSMSVTVSQGNEFVNDADEVEFEIWKEGQKDSSEMIKAKLSEDGKYMISHHFKEEGIYYVQSHVQARDMHTMPKKAIQIGTVNNKAHE